MTTSYNAGTLTSAQLSGFENFWKTFSDVFPEFDFTLGSDSPLPSPSIPLPLKPPCPFSLTSDPLSIPYEACVCPLAWASSFDPDNSKPKMSCCFFIFADEMPCRSLQAKRFAILDPCPARSLFIPPSSFVWAESH